jgi:exopolysaccharide biosynthesis polyprenyl glycosylphosphotransferase
MPQGQRIQTVALSTALVRTTVAGKRFERDPTTEQPAQPQAGGQRLRLIAAEDAELSGVAVATEEDPGGALLTTARPSSLPAPQDPALGITEAGPAGATKRRDTLYRRGLALADIIAAAVALILGVWVLGDDRITVPLIAAIPLVVLVSKIVGLYDRDEHLVRRTTLEEAPALFQVATLYTLLIWLGDSQLVQETHTIGRGASVLGHAQVVGIWGLLFFCMLGARAAARDLVRRATPPERCLVLGSSAAVDQVQRKFHRARALTATVVGRVPLEEGEGERSGSTALGDIAGLDRLLRQYAIERVIIAPTTADSEQLLEAIRRVKALGVKVSVLPRLFEVVGSSVRFDDIEGLMLLGVPHYGLTKSSRLVKRAVDVVGSAIGLLVLAPLLAVIAVAIKLTSPGPVLFRQTRVGKGGVEFVMLKFRTMHDGADEAKAELLERNEAEGLFKIADDPRLTRVGEVLRRFSLDELPQLWNVLRGEMSLVGPRPLVTDDDRLVEGWHRRRLDLPPGMTGIWQVLGSARIPLKEMVKLDYLYGANWSIWVDLRILLRTVPHVLGRRGM